MSSGADEVEDVVAADWHQDAATLADELRLLADALSVRELRAVDLEKAQRALAVMRRDLETKRRRPRWYDASEDAMSFTPESVAAYHEQSPVRGRLNPVAPPLEIRRIERADGSPAIAGRVRLGMRYEGPPHGVHGGIVAALFDEVLGAAQGLANVPGVTATLRVRYRAVTPIERELRFEGWIARQRGRRLIVKATCHAGDTLTADAEGLFVRVDFNAMQDRMRRGSALAGAGRQTECALCEGKTRSAE